jgi:hypothetical protein
MCRENASAFVIAGHKARSAVFAPDDPAIHADRRMSMRRFDSLHVTIEQRSSAVVTIARRKGHRHCERQRSNPDGSRRYISPHAMTRTRIFTTSRRRGRARASQVSKPAKFRPFGMAKLWRKRVTGTIAPARRCRRAIARNGRASDRQTGPFRQTIVQLLPSGWLAPGTSTFGAGTPTNPKRALPVFIRLYANSNFAHAAFSTGSEKTS